MAKYERRKKYELRLSENQLDQFNCISMLDSAINLHNIKLKDIPSLNPEWIDTYKLKRMGLHDGMIQSLKQEGLWDGGCFQIRKTRKGYVISLKFNWRSKGIKETEVICECCKKSRLVNIFGICENCEKKLKSKRQYTKYLYGDKKIKGDDENGKNKH